MDTQDMGLRERKRIETKGDLEAATIKLVVQHGLEQTTIDMICEAANVSKRTFFNYFDSKEDAILGLHDVEIDDAFLAGHATKYATMDTIPMIVGLIFSVVGPSISDPRLHKSRLQVIRQHPQLLERQMARMVRMTKQFSEAIQALLQQRHKASVSQTHAEVLLSLCSSGVRMAVREWATTDTKISLSALEKRSIQLIKEALEKI